MTDISPLSDISFANIFFHSVCFFIFLMSSDTHMFFLSMKSSFPIFFSHCAFGGISKKALPNPRSPQFIPMLSPESFIALASVFRSLVHFELIFMDGMR